SLQGPVDEGDVAGLRSREAVQARAPVRSSSPPTAPPGGPAAMTVDAHHLAPRQLGLDNRRRDSFRDHRADVSPLRADVIEFEHERIGLPAFEAWRRAKLRLHQRPGFVATAPASRPDLLAVCPASLAEVLAEALAAPPLTPARVAVEVAGGTYLAAAPAPPRLTGDIDRAAKGGSRRDRHRRWR